MRWSYSVVLTSCERFDLLEQTLQSLIPNLSGPLDEIVVIEDSPDRSVQDVLDAISKDIRLIQNNPQLGQMRSIDKIYETIKSSHAFHCEDDWEFTRGGFIEESITILDNFPKVSMVGLRPRHELNPRIRNAPQETLEEIEFFRLDPKAHPEYFSYSFNPGLRRMIDLKPFLPMAEKGGEHDISYAFKNKGSKSPTWSTLQLGISEPNATFPIQQPDRKPKRFFNALGAQQKSESNASNES